MKRSPGLTPRGICRKAGRLFVKSGVEGVEIFGVQLILHRAERFTEALEVDNFALPQKFDRVAHVGIVDQAQQIVIGSARLLFCCHVLKQVGDGIALGLEGFCREGPACRRLRINAGCVIDIVRLKVAFFDVVNRNIPRELVNDCADNFKMRQLFSAWMM